MGALTLPPTGAIYVDANTVIYTVQRHSHYYPVLEVFWEQVEAESREVVGSDLLLLETLVAPMRSGDSATQAAFEEALIEAAVKLLPITREVLREPARLRATIPSLRTPDAIHAATALIQGCALFLSNDAGFRSVPGLPLVVLDDVVAGSG